MSLGLIAWQRPGLGLPGHQGFMAKMPPGRPPLSLASLTRRAQLAVQTKRVAAQVDGGAQVQQVLNIECLRDFLMPPLLSVRFR